MELKDVLSPDALTLFLYFIVPGLVALQVYDIIVPTERRDFGESFIQILSYGLLINLVWYRVYQWALDTVSTGKFHQQHAWVYPLVYASSILVVALIMPILLAILLYKARTERGLLTWILHRFGIKHIPASQLPTVWDAYFGKKQRATLVFHLKSGEKIAGAFGDRSYASAHPGEQQVYVEEVFTINEDTGYVERTPGRAGGIIRFEECEYIETIAQQPFPTTSTPAAAAPKGQP